MDHLVWRSYVSATRTQRSVERAGRRPPRVARRDELLHRPRRAWRAEAVVVDPSGPAAEIGCSSPPPRALRGVSFARPLGPPVRRRRTRRGTEALVHIAGPNAFCSSSRGVHAPGSRCAVVTEAAGGARPRAGGAAPRDCLSPTPSPTSPTTAMANCSPATCCSPGASAGRTSWAPTGRRCSPDRAPVEVFPATTIVHPPRAGDDPGDGSRATCSSCRSAAAGKRADGGEDRASSTRRRSGGDAALAQ
jgi:hypothetical protein